MTIRYDMLTDPPECDLRAIVALYRQAGWWWPAGLHLEAARRIVAGSHCFCVARRKEGIVGMGRAISDGASDAYLQDLTVLPAFRGRGIASAILRTLVARLQEDGITWIGVVAADGTAPLYRNLGLGFVPMPAAQPLVLEC